jgi:hypothetical protein
VMLACRLVELVCCNKRMNDDEIYFLNCVDDPGWYLHHGADIGLGYKNIFTRCIYIIPQVFSTSVSVHSPMESP